MSSPALTVEFAAIGWNLERCEVVSHEFLAITAGVGSGAVIYEDLCLRAIPGQHSLLHVEEERHEVLLIGRRGKLHHPLVLEARTDRSDHRYSHLLRISYVQLRLVLLCPALCL